MNTNRSLLVFGAILLVVGGAVYVVRSRSQSGDTVTQSHVCDIHSGPCVQALGSGRVFLEIEPKPVTALKDLLFRVRLEGIPADQAPGIDLGMPGMDMGPNHVDLELKAPQTYEGTGVIVKCPSGRRTWFARVNVSGVGTAEFVFDVVY